LPHTVRVSIFCSRFNLHFVALHSDLRYRSRVVTFCVDFRCSLGVVTALFIPFSPRLSLYAFSRFRLFVADFGRLPRLNFTSFCYYVRSF